MSASPAGGPPSGPPSTTPNGGPMPAARRRKPAGIFHAKKPVRKPAPAPPRQGTPGAAPNGAANNQATRAPLPENPSNVYAKPVVETQDAPGTYTDFPLMASKKSVLEGLRFHAMRFQSDSDVNPWNEAVFTRPLRLHRRFPRDQMIVPEPIVDSVVDDKEREKEAVRKAERQAEREANQAQIAPTDKSQAAAARKKNPFKKKTEDVLYPTDTPEAQKRAKLRYEEGRPWHLEDFEGKNTWVGSYEEPLSETHSILRIGPEGFTMIPLEKWYKFIPTGRYKTMDLDEAEKRMAMKVKEGRWFMDRGENSKIKQLHEEARLRRLEYGRVGMRGERRVKSEDDDDARPDFANDVDEIDFDMGEDFQDDDEGKLILGDEEDVKDAERRIKEEHLSANIFAGTGVKEEKDWYEEEEKEKRQAEEERKKARKMQKRLIKRERRNEYDDESDSNPYSDSSDTEDSDVERQREEEERKRVEENSAAEKANSETGVHSGASSRGTNTPSGRAEKRADPLRKATSNANLKRPGSPNLSEASGSESTHKRLKKKHDANGRPMSPAAATSDAEASGTEALRPRPKMANSLPTSPPHATPNGSRAASPAPAAGGGSDLNSLPSADEVRAAIPKEGITIPALLAQFRSRLPKGAEVNKAFIRIVKTVGKSGDKNTIVPK